MRFPYFLASVPLRFSYKLGEWANKLSCLGSQMYNHGRKGLYMIAPGLKVMKHILLKGLRRPHAEIYFLFNQTRHENSIA